MKWLRRGLIAIVVLALLGYCGVLAWVYANQRGVQYEAGGKMYALSETKLQRTQLISIPTGDGSKLAAWYAPPQAGKPLILYFRGNAGSFSREYERYEAMEVDGYGFVAFDYRGFGGSPGEISQTHVLEDSLAAYEWAAAKGFPIVIWGRSLGSGPATYVASLRKSDALFLETPFDSAAAVGRDRYWYLPVALLTKDNYPVDQWIGKVTAPVFVAHGTADRKIAEYHGQRVYDLAPDKAGIWIEPGAGHDDLWARSEWEKAKQLFAAAEAAAGR